MQLPAKQALEGSIPTPYDIIFSLALRGGYQYTSTELLAEGRVVILTGLPNNPISKVKYVIYSQFYLIAPQFIGISGNGLVNTVYIVYVYMYMYMSWL